MPAPAAVGRPALTLGEVLRTIRSALAPRLPSWQSKIIGALCACRTPALGGHRYQCSACQGEHFVPHSCRNRHCPTCQTGAALEWLVRQETALLPVPYFHLIVTLPHDLNPLIAQNQAPLLNLLFASASATVLDFGRRHFDADLGLTAILHTWGQTLIDHYHLHILVTGGGLSCDRTRWARVPENFLFPVSALSTVFRAKFCQGLQDLYARGTLQFHGQLLPLAQTPHFQALVRRATRRSWNVHIKRPFAGPGTVLRYLSRYTHRVALGPSRLQRLDRHRQSVTFSYKDYADHDRIKSLELSFAEFLRRFCLHLLPARFVKIRHYGLLANSHRQQRLALARQLLSTQSAACPEDAPTESPPASTPVPPPPPLRCPHCQQQTLVLVEIVPPVKDPAVLDSS